MNRRELMVIGMGLLTLSACKSTNSHRTKRAFIVHGYGADVDSHWFSWLATKLSNQGISAVIIPLPDSDQPDFTAWQQTLEQYIDTPRASDVFIAHSLGTISLLHYLSTHRKAVHHVVLVSGFGERLPDLPYINAFNVDAYVSQARLEKAFLSQHIRHLTHLISTNDSIVSPKMSHRLAYQLGGEVILVENGGHFLGSDGFTSLPWAYEALLNTKLP